MELTEGLAVPRIRASQILQGGFVVLSAAAASLIFALHSHNGILLAAVLVLITAVTPGVYVVSRRMATRARHMEVEDHLLMNTRTFLSTQEAARPVNRSSGLGVAPESDAEILARVLDGRKPAMQGFRQPRQLASLLPVGDPVLFDALPRRHTAHSACEERSMALVAQLPPPVTCFSKGAAEVR